MDDERRLDHVFGRVGQALRLVDEHREKALVVAGVGRHVADAALDLRRLRERAQVEADDGALDPGAGLGDGERVGGLHGLAERHQRRVAAGRRGVDAERAFDDQSLERHTGLARRSDCTPTMGPARSASAVHTSPSASTPPW